MADHFLMCARAVKDGAFISEPGPSLFLRVPDGEVPSPDHATDSPEIWFKNLRSACIWGKDSRKPDYQRGDLLVFVHGYNNDQNTVMKRHRLLKSNLSKAGYKGEVLSFDWPSANMALNYLEDRHDAKITAIQLVNDGIRALSSQQRPDCTINIHLLGHSTGAYVIREAFDDADDCGLDNNSWVVSQVVFIGGDISSDSLKEGCSSTESIFRHCVRLTNYSNSNDSVLKLSNVKRLGMAPRVGRVGLPGGAPTKAVNVDCSAYYEQLSKDQSIKQADHSGEELGAFDHSWHFNNIIFARDLFETLKGDMDRASIPTRSKDSGGNLWLKRP
jgi:esterase/lipase superfamily enzyme